MAFLQQTEKTEIKNKIKNNWREKYALKKGAKNLKSHKTKKPSDLLESGIQEVLDKIKERKKEVTSKATRNEPHGIEMEKEFTSNTQALDS